MRILILTIASLAELDVGLAMDPQMTIVLASYQSQGGESVDDLTAQNQERLFSSSRVIGGSVCMNTDGCDWKLAGHNIWYIGPSEEPNTIPQLLYRLLALSLKTIAQFIEGMS
jgi:hypothetical protein